MKKKLCKYFIWFSADDSVENRIYIEYFGDCETNEKLGEGQRERERERQTDRQTERETDREKEKERQRETKRETERDRETEEESMSGRGSKRIKERY